MSPCDGDHFAAYVTEPATYPENGTFKEKASWFFKSQSFINCMFALIATLVMLFITTILLQVCNFRRPATNRLPDTLHELIPYKNLILPTEIMMYVSIGLTVFIMLFNVKMRTFQILRRVLISYTIIMIFRDITMSITSLPDPSERCQSFEKTAVSLKPKSMVNALMKGITCGDMIFSGHAVAFLLPVLILSHFYHKYLWIPFFIIAIVGSLLIIISHLHYSVDVVLSWMVCPMVFFIYNTISEHPENYENSLPFLIKWYFAHMEWNDPIIMDDYIKQKDSVSDAADQTDNSPQAESSQELSDV